MKSKGIHISAFGIHAGGGAVLLGDLLTHFSEQIVGLAVDIRLSKSLIRKDWSFVEWIPKNLIARICSVNTLAKRCKIDEVLFCFNSLPPIVRSKGRVIVFVHAPHFVGLHAGIQYDTISRIRFAVERFWFKFGYRYVDEFWVQTESMQRALIASFPQAAVKVKPFVDECLAGLLQLKEDVLPVSKPARAVFFYPADGVGHKNHVNLIHAWEHLAEKYGLLCPSLVLTLAPNTFDRICKSSEIYYSVPYVINLGSLSRELVFENILKSDALIFPSLAETFGLPLLEAVACGRSIIASERDFVRDVCTPVETFDPDSPVSIVRAVERYLGINKMIVSYKSASALLSEIL